MNPNAGCLSGCLSGYQLVFLQPSDQAYRQVGLPEQPHLSLRAVVRSCT